MSKILSGFIGLFLVVGVVAGVGYALFTDTIEINGMVLGTSNPDLLICADDHISTCDADFDLSSYTSFAQKLIPGDKDWGEFYFYNNSDNENLYFSLTAQLTQYGGNWAALKGAVEARICLYPTAGSGHCDPDKATPWYTLEAWNTYNVTLPGGPLEPGDFKHYAVELRIPERFGNEIAGKTVDNIKVVITGTQTTPPAEVEE